MKMGKYMEKMLVEDADQFRSNYIIDEATGRAKSVGVPDEEYYNYSICGWTLLRSQIDCVGETINGVDKFFEIKTRACAPIRYDLPNYISYLDYDIWLWNGVDSSYEREIYDLIWAGFQKYSWESID